MRLDSDRMVDKAIQALFRYPISGTARKSTRFRKNTRFARMSAGESSCELIVIACGTISTGPPETATDLLLT